MSKILLICQNFMEINSEMELCDDIPSKKKGENRM